MKLKDIVNQLKPTINTYEGEFKVLQSEELTIDENGDIELSHKSRKGLWKTTLEYKGIPILVFQDIESSQIFEVYEEVVATLESVFNRKFDVEICK